MGVKDLEDLKKISMLRSQIDGITVGEILITDFPSVKSEDKMSDVLSVMRDSGFQEIPIVDEGNYVGMVSYGSILRKRSVTPDTKVKNLVRNLPTLTTSTEITKIAELMVMNNCRQLAVLNGKKVLGIVSRTGLTKIAARMKALKDIRVWEIMTTPVEFLRENAMLDDALDIMRRLDIRTVPVVNNADKIIGIVGMKEIIDNYWKSENKIFGDFEKSSKAQILIESVCSTTVVTTDWGSDMGTAAQIMEDGRFSTLPVVDGEELVGIITEYDIIELINACRDRDALFVQISGLEEDDKEYAESMYSDIASEITKISKIYKPESLIMHVSRYNESGERKKYSIIGKMFIDGTTINAKEVGWDLIQTNAALIKKIGDMVVNMKETRTTFRRRKK
ncbi:MAG: CBS domain-containing protein [Candidatus Methanomethylophilaceae archaeon]|nr:CBS domain-containing protein [Candidatus Methanomethylophilaceae archaeon]MDD3379150.1 CBS domain-containing protein [Candidatus Methanomethylophilaceae archaeon]MDY0224322.1 CBS domain-containing protein [Candidatus Methanomethylophilaceae archaeon]